MAKKLYMCDFETTNNLNDCRVWAACAVDMEDGSTAHLSNDLDAFMEWVIKQGSSTLYFHNLKFDGEFILSWLFFHGYKHVTNEKKAIPQGCFQTLIDDMGQFYKLSICFERKGKRLKKCDIFDSLKKLPDKAAKIAKDYGLPVSKGSIDYNAPRSRGYEITPEEKDYIETDCRIIQMALGFQFAEGMKKMTIASDALSFYKEMMGRRFEYWFPVLPKIVDDDLRAAYKGGFTWCNPRWAGQDIGCGVVLDVNSLYPDSMYSNPLPWGYPVYFEGKYKPNDYYPLYIARIRCAFQLKPDHIPTVQIKGTGLWRETEYLESSEIEVDGYKDYVAVDLTMTSVDLELFLAHYDIIGEIEYKCGYMFKAQSGMFQQYIDHWMHIKATSPKGSAQRAIAKLFLNSLYGKFGSSTERYNKNPVLCPDGVVRYYSKQEPERDKNGNILFDPYGRIMYKLDENGCRVTIEPEEVDPVYTPVAAFITAYARRKTISSAQAVFDRFVYADTDSLHLIGDELPEGLEIHPTKLGAWDHEKTFQRARFLRAKTYIEEVDGRLEVTCAGMPDNVKYPQEGEKPGTKHPTWDNFHRGEKYPGKLLPKRVKGGIVLDPIDFEISLW